jgi:hypothetical protein
MDARIPLHCLPLVLGDDVVAAGMRYPAVDWQPVGVHHGSGATNSTINARNVCASALRAATSCVRLQSPSRSA